jgi:uncharacterized protein YndB with AHSA1/START domain
MKSAEPELVFTRIVDAPREQVFEAWTDRAHLKKWLASEGWTVSVALADPRPGAPSLVVMQSRSGEVMTVTLTFEDSGSGTRYTARVRHWPVGEEEANEKMGLELR